MNFWQKIKEERGNILCLAPMADVTDSAFRYIIAKNSTIPYVGYTEFVSADGLVLAPEEGRKKLLKDLEYTEIERPIVAQFFTSKPENMEKAARLAVELGFDGVDINMGCPDKSIEKQGAGASLINNPALARELIRAAKRGTEDKIPVSVKTRLGYNKDELETWLPELLAENPAVIILHARTRKEMSLVPARWERVKRAVEIRNTFQKSFEKSTDIFQLKNSSSSLQSSSLGTFQNFSGTQIIGNGDVENLEHAKKLTEETGADGVMLGRAVFGNPFLFSDHLPTLPEKLEILVEHVKLFEEKLGQVKSFAVMKKHFKSYLKDFPHAKDLRVSLMEAQSAKEAVGIVNNFILSYN